jgi:hypothetical protein
MRCLMTTLRKRGVALFIQLRPQIPFDRIEGEVISFQPQVVLAIRLG